MSTNDAPTARIRTAIPAALLLLAIALAGCDGNGNNNNRTPTPSPSPTLDASVQLSTLGIPAAWMVGEEQPPERFLKAGSGPDDCPVGQGCRTYTYTNGAGWAALGWWPAGCGQRGTDAAYALAKSGACGVNVLQQGGLKSVARVSFLVKGRTGNEQIGFQVGGDDMPPMPKRGPYQFKLTTDWQRREVDLRGVDMNNAVILFLWVATDNDNPSGAVFYLDDVKFEGSR